MFLSQRPNNDPQQWEHRVTGKRFPDTYEAGTEAGLCDDNPRPEFTQTRDPKPWDLFGVRFAIRPITPGAVWIPRHEEFDTPVNTILAEFRHNLTVSPSLGLGLAEGYLRWSEAGSGEPTWTAEERDHARRVLSKLVAVYS